MVVGINILYTSNYNKIFLDLYIYVYLYNLVITAKYNKQGILSTSIVLYNCFCKMKNNELI